MMRYLSNPRDTGVLHRHPGVEALGQRLVYQSSALLGQQFQQLAFLLDQCVEVGGLFVEVAMASCVASGGIGNKASFIPC